MSKLQIIVLSILGLVACIVFSVVGVFLLYFLVLSSQQRESVEAYIAQAIRPPASTATFGVATRADFFAVKTPPGDYLLTYTTQFGGSSQFQLLIRANDTALTTVGLNPGDQVVDAAIQAGTITDTSQLVATKSGPVTVYMRGSSSGNVPILADIFSTGGAPIQLISQGKNIGLQPIEIPKQLPIIPPFPNPDPGDLPVSNHLLRCHALAQAAAVQGLANKISQSLAANNAIEEIKRQLITEIVKDPENIMLSQPGDSENLSVEVKTNEQNIRFSIEVTDKVDLDIEVEIKDIADNPDISVDPSEVTLGSTDYGIGFEAADGKIVSKNNGIARVSKADIDEENKKITAIIQGVQPGRTAIEGGFARLNVKISVTVSYSIGGQSCPPIPIPDIALPASVEMDPFAVPVEVKEEATPTPRPAPPTPTPTPYSTLFPGLVKVSCDLPIVTVESQYTNPHEHSETFFFGPNADNIGPYSDVSGYVSGPVKDVLRAGFTVPIPPGSNVGVSEDYSNWFECEIPGACSATYKFSGINSSHPFWKTPAVSGDQRSGNELHDKSLYDAYPLSIRTAYPWELWDITFTCIF